MFYFFSWKDTTCKSNEGGLQLREPQLQESKVREPQLIESLLYMRASTKSTLITKNLNILNNIEIKRLIHSLQWFVCLIGNEAMFEEATYVGDRMNPCLSKLSLTLWDMPFNHH